MINFAQAPGPAQPFFYVWTTPRSKDHYGPHPLQALRQRPFKYVCGRVRVLSEARGTGVIFIINLTQTGTVWYNVDTLRVELNSSLTCSSVSVILP